MTASAESGIPIRPILEDKKPSLITPLPLNSVQFSCTLIGTLTILLYCKAILIKSASCTDLPSSENKRTPELYKLYIGDNIFPSLPLLIAPTGITFTKLTLFALDSIYSTTIVLSITGFVSGIIATVVYPPIAAHLEPLSKSSSSVFPGSLK